MMKPMKSTLPLAMRLVTTPDPNQSSRLPLVQAGVDHGKRGAQQQHATPIRLGEQLAIDVLVGGTEPGQQRHDHGDRGVLPIDPLPAEVLNIEAHQRHAGVVNESQAECVNREPGKPPLHRQIAQHDHDRRRNEKTQQQAMDKVRDQQHLVIADEGDAERRSSIDQTRHDQHTAHTEYGGEPGDRGSDKDLGPGRNCAQPRALVKA
jgi:hypothetical protein